MYSKLPALDEFLDEYGRETEKETTVSEEALHIPISQLDLGPPATVEADMSVRALIGEMIGCEVSSILVVDEGRPIGIVTERDILVKAVEAPEDFDLLDVRSIMRPETTPLSLNDRIIDAMDLIHEADCRRATVVNEKGVPVGILCCRTVVDRLVEFFPEDIINLPPRPIRCMTRREGP